jgi:hypothetical protein
LYKNHENEKVILNRCFCGFWGNQSQKKDHGYPFEFEYKTSLNDIYTMEIMLGKKGDEYKGNSEGFQFKPMVSINSKDLFTMTSKNKFQFFWGLTKKKESENFEFTKFGEFYKAICELEKISWEL